MTADSTPLTTASPEAQDLQERVATLETELQHVRKENESLRESAHKNLAWLEHSPVCTKILDLDFNLQYMSQAGVTALSIDRIEDFYRGPYPLAFFSEGFRASMLEALEQVRDRGEVAFQEAPPTALDGRTLWFRSTLLPVFDDHQKLGSIMVVSVDITDRVKAEKERVELERQLLHAQKLESLGVLAGGIAHDFNNILMTILGNADLAHSSLPKGDPARSNLQKIELASRRAAGLSAQMLAYSGKGKFLIEPIHLGHFLKEMSHLLEVALSKKAKWKLAIAEDLPYFQGDATQVRQVIMNLITNASEAIGQNPGTITLTAGAMDCDQAYLEDCLELLGPAAGIRLKPGRYVFCEIADTGCGMEANTMSRVFDPFFTTKFTGRGLGMAAVLGIVRGHEGTIKVHSEVGKGTSFRVLFPAGSAIASAPLGAAPAVAPSATWKGKGTILIADDEEAVCLVGKEMLEHFGFQVFQANDGQQAIAVFQDRGAQIDCVLLDLTMPHLDGAQVFQEMRRTNPKIKIILTSGYHVQDLAARFADSGPDGFLQKPYDMAALREVLAKVMT